MKAWAWLIFGLMTAQVGEGAIVNFGHISTHLYRGGRLEGREADFKELQALGVSTIVNLDMLLVDDEDLCKQYAMDCQRFPLLLLPGRERFFDFELFKKAYQAVVSKDPKDGGTYIHCYHGSDRTGMLAAALTIRSSVCAGEPYDRQTLEQAIIDDLTRYTFHRSFFPTLYKNVLEWIHETPAWICANTQNAEHLPGS